MNSKFVICKNHRKMWCEVATVFKIVVTASPMHPMNYEPRQHGQLDKSLVSPVPKPWILATIQLYILHHTLIS